MTKLEQKQLELGLTTKEMANKLGIPHFRYIEYIKGIHYPSRTKAVKIAEVIGGYPQDYIKPFELSK